MHAVVKGCVCQAWISLKKLLSYLQWHWHLRRPMHCSQQKRRGQEDSQVCPHWHRHIRS